MRRPANPVPDRSSPDRFFPTTARSRERPARRGHPWQSFRRAVSWHRRTLAALAAGLAVLTGLAAAAPEGPARSAVVTVASSLPGGAVLSADDLVVRELVTDDLPEAPVSDPGQLVGRTLAAPVARGQVLTDLAVVGPRAGVAAGRLLAPLRLADTGLAPLLRPGDVVDIIAAGQDGTAAVVGRSVRVVTVPAPPEAATADTPGTLVLVEVTSATATELARAAAAGSLSVVWHGGGE